MTEREGVDALLALEGADNELAHSKADDILLQFVPESVRTAYELIRNSVGFWYA